MPFDLDKSCAVLQQLQERETSVSEAEHFRRAALSLHFIVDSGHLLNFEDYLACFELDALADLAPSFTTRAQAQAWLRQALVPGPIPGLLVEGHRYSIGYSLDEGLRFLIRVPSKEEAVTVWPDPEDSTRETVACLLRAGARVTSAEQRESIQRSVLALRFLGELGQSSDLERFARVFDLRTSFVPLRVFASRADAEAWLSGHPRPPHGARIQIADRRFSVGYERESGFRVLVRSPSMEELGLLE